MKKQLILILLMLTLSANEMEQKVYVDSIIELKNFEEDEKIEKLINSLRKLNDIIIYDIDYNEKVAIAVGADNSLKTRRLSSKNAYSLGITLYSFDSGKHWHKSFGGDVPSEKVIVLEGTKAIAVGMMEGLGGQIEMTNNAGKDWKNVYLGGFMNDITQHSNGFFAVGYGIIKSKDGKKWQTVLDGEKYTFNAIFSIDKKRLIVVYGNKILYSEDSGKSWKKSQLPLILEDVWLATIYKKKGKLYVSSHSNNLKIVSIDNGKSWKKVSQHKEDRIK